MLLRCGGDVFCTVVRGVRTKEAAAGLRPKMTMDNVYVTVTTIQLLSTLWY